MLAGYIATGKCTTVRLILMFFGRSTDTAFLRREQGGMYLL